MNTPHETAPQAPPPPPPPPGCPICQGSRVVDDKWGMAWPMLLASPDPDVALDISQGVIRPTFCQTCSTTGADHAAALDAVAGIKRNIRTTEGARE